MGASLESRPFQNTEHPNTTGLKPNLALSGVSFPHASGYIDAKANRFLWHGTKPFSIPMLQSLRSEVVCSAYKRYGSGGVILKKKSWRDPICIFLVIHDSWLADSLTELRLVTCCAFCSASNYLHDLGPSSRCTYVCSLLTHTTTGPKFEGYSKGTLECLFQKTFPVFQFSPLETLLIFLCN